MKSAVIRVPAMHGDHPEQAVIWKTVQVLRNKSIYTDSYFRG